MDIVKILASEPQSRIIKALQVQPRYADELAKLLNKSKPAISNQLRKLERFGIIYQQNEASAREHHIYALRPPIDGLMRKITNLLTQVDEKLSEQEGK